MTLQELQALMQQATASNDVAKIEEIAGQIVASKKDRAKAENDRLQKEEVALAGSRQTLATKIHGAVVAMGLDKELLAVKAWGYTYKVDKAVPGAEDTVYKSVALSTIAVKASKGGGSSSTGKSKDEYGLSLGEIFDKHATDEDKAKLASAESNSKQWQVKVAVKKKAISDGKLTPVK